jgi:hypothetical protein
VRADDLGARIAAASDRAIAVNRSGGARPRPCARYKRGHIWVQIGTLVDVRLVAQK